jgi:hypothetical protein
MMPIRGSKEPAKDSIKILEYHIGKTRDRFEDDFMVWFTKIEKIAKGHKEGVWRQENI